jgi:DNA recombination protein RmuC
MEFVLVALISLAGGAWLSLKLAGVRELRLRGLVLQDELSSARATEAELRAKLEAEQLRSAEKLALLTAAEQKLANAFAALSAESLRANNEAFLQLANQTLSRFHETARSELDGRQKAIGESLQPVKEYLDRVDVKIGELEKARVAAYSTLAEQVKSLAITQGDLHKETSNLVKALRTPHTSGRWGEVQLRRVVEMAGMLERCDFVEQHTIHTESGRLRPDLIVRLPNGRSIVVDSKAPLSAYLESIEAADDVTRIARLKDHAAQVRTHVRALSQKGYWSQLESTPEFAVAFLPGEPFFSAALEHDPELIEYGVELGVVIATPTTLVALLKAVAYGWRQQEMARNAHEISKLGSEIYDRLSRFASTFAKVGSHLGKAVDSYNSSVGTLESRVLPSARRIKEKGATGAAEIAELQPVDKTARPLHAGELLESPQSPLT